MAIAPWGRRRAGAAEATGPLQRRGMLAGLAALVAAGLAKATEHVAQAAGDGAFLTMGNANNTTNNPASETRLNRSAVGAVLTLNAQAGSTAMLVNSGFVQAYIGYDVDPAFKSGTLGALGGGVVGAGLAGQCGPTNMAGIPSIIGVAGFAQNNLGAIGVRGDGVAIGVQGLASTVGLGAGAGTGVLGQSVSGPGVRGQSTSGNGVFGQADSSAGVWGTAISGPGTGGQSVSAAGVYGVSFTADGVRGFSTSGMGMHGISSASIGVLGEGGGNNAGLAGFGTAGPGAYGQSTSGTGAWGTSTSGTGVYGTSSTGLAGWFVGPVQVNGGFTVVGGPKSAAVPHPDGSHRRLYCVESPESCFEDFGRDRLVNGRGRVRLDPDFAAVVHSDNYDVVLTAEGDCNGLYVNNKTPQGFDVQEFRGGTSTVGFSYRVVAKRKDIAGPRLERVTVTREAPAAPRAPAADHGAVTPPVLPPVPPLPDSKEAPRNPMH